eukprot:scaffold28899_cov118-Isochrysis_galbana.AAC.1
MSGSGLCALLQPVGVGFVTDALCVFNIEGLPAPPTVREKWPIFGARSAPIFLALFIIAHRLKIARGVAMAWRHVAISGHGAQETGNAQKTHTQQQQH